VEFFKSMKQWVRPSIEEAEEMREAVEKERVQKEISAAERRIHERVRLEAEVTGFSESNFFTGFTEDISEGGVFIATHCPPVVGIRVEVAVKIGEGSAMVLTGEVVWHRGQGSDISGCGVRFIDLTEEQTVTLAGVLQRLDREPLFYDLDD
jgi:uncharacterized protein (TIGR02266 family)